MSRFLKEALRAVEPYTPGEQPRGVQDLLKLNTNENPFPPSPMVQKALHSGEIARLNLYSDPNCADFLRVLADTLRVGCGQVLAGNGSDEVLQFAFSAFAEKGAAYPDITYGFYDVLSRFFGLPSQIVPLREDLTVAVEDYEGFPGMVVLANPNAPTGLYLPLRQIEKLLCQDPNRLCLIDEAYIDFGGESAVSLLPRYENLLVVRTFSKSRSLAGARLGFAAGSEDVIRDLNTVRCSINPYNVNSLTLLAGISALRDADYFAKCCAEITAVRDWTARQLRGFGFTVTQSSTNFVFAGKNPRISGAEYYAALRKNNILVRHFAAPRTADWVRVSVGTRAQMERLVEATRGLL